MKKILHLLLLSLLLSSLQSSAINWVRKATFSGIERDNAVAFSIGTKGYLGTGSNDYLLKDFWQYDPATDSWTQKADFGGGYYYGAIGFSIGTKGYIGSESFWEYNPDDNSWNQKASLPNSVYYGTAFSIGSKGYVGGGGQPSFYEYDPATDTWTSKKNFIDTISSIFRWGGALGFSIGNKGYMGMGWDDSSPDLMAHDFWEYDPATDTWTQKADLAGAGRAWGISFSMGGMGYIGGGLSDRIYNDLWMYDPTTNSWTLEGNLAEAVYLCTSFCIGNNLYVAAGYNDVSYSSSCWGAYIAPCQPTITCSGPTTFCTGDSVILTASPGTNYLWSTSATTQSITVKTSGMYFVTEDGCSSSMVPVTVNTFPTAYIFSNSPVCQGNTINLLSGGPGSFTWSGPNGFSATQPNPTISNASSANAGIYTVTVTTNGCSSTATTSVTVNPLPTPTASSNSPILEGNTLSLTSGGGTSYSWTGPNGFTSTQQNPSISDVSSVNTGTYSVTVANMNGCTATATVTCLIKVAGCNKPLGSSLIQATDGKFYGMSPYGGAYDVGVIFQYDPTTSVYTILHEFNGSDGSTPFGDLIQASDGKLYGLTSGGITGPGVLFQFDPVTFTYTKKFDFGGVNGVDPEGSLIQASDGKLYGMTNGGGYYSDGVIFQFDPATSTYTKKHDFQWYIDGAMPYGSLIQGTDGMLYGMTSSGGADPFINPDLDTLPIYNGSLFQYNPVSGNIAVLHVFQDSSDGFSFPQGSLPYASLLQGSDGKLYGMTNQGGLYNDGILFQYDLGTSTFTKAIDFSGINGAWPFGSLMQASDGKIYGLTSQGGTSNFGTMFQFDPVSFTLTKIYDFTGADGAYPECTLMQASNGMLYGSTMMLGDYTTKELLFQYDITTSTFTKKLDSSAPTITANGPTTFACWGSVTLTASEGYIYMWSNSATTQSIVVTTSGTYGVSVDGCVAASPVTVIVTRPTVGYSVSPSTSICAGSSVTLSGTGASSYSWSGGVSNGVAFTPLYGNTYTVTGTDANGCTNTASVTVTLISVHVSIGISPSTTVCAGTTVGLNGSGAVSYSWSGGITDRVAFTALTTTTYTVTGTSATGCTGTSSVTITVNPLPAATASSNSPVCAGTTLSLTSGGGTSYSWIGPNNFTSTQQNPTINNASSSKAGIYTVTVSNSCGSGTATTSVSVNPLPTAAASSNSPICSGSTINLTSSGGTSYSWTGPNGFTSTQQNPAISNTSSANAGTYIVTVTNSCGSSTSATTITVRQLPTATASSNTPVCTGSTINLHSTGGNSYAWSGPNNYTSTQRDPTISNAFYVNAGTYTVTATINGCSATATTSVTVNPLPVATASNSGPVCVGLDPIELYSTGGTSYLWTGPNNFATDLQNFILTPSSSSAAGTYTVTVTNNSGCSSTATTTVIVIPIQPITVSSNSPVCTGSTINLTSSGGTSYSWSGPNSFTSSQQNPVISNALAANAGIYTVTVTNSCGSFTATTSVTVNPSPVATASHGGVLCEGYGAFDLYSDGGTSYHWLGPNTFSSNLQNPQVGPISLAMSGTYTVSVASNGCFSTATTTIAVIPRSVAPVSNNGPVCQGNTLNLYANINYGTSYYWTGPNGFTSTLQNPSIPNASASASGIYSVLVGLMEQCPAYGIANVFVNPLPNASSSNNSPVNTGATLNLYSSGGTSRTWSGPNGYSSTQQNPSITNISLAGAGIYTVTVTDPNGCTNSATTTVTVNSLPTAVVTGGGSECSGDTAIMVSFNFTGTAPCTLTYAINGLNQTPVTGIMTTPYIIHNAAAGRYTITSYRDANSSGTFSGSATVTVNSRPVISSAASDTSICSATKTAIYLSSNLTSTIFSYSSVVSEGTVTGNIPGSGPIIAQALTNTGTTTATLTYTITGTKNGCAGNTIYKTVHVYPKPSGTASPVSVAICSATRPSISLSGPVTGSTFNYTSAVAGSTITGATSSCTNCATINDSLYNTGVASGTVTYNITPWANGCAGTVFKDVVTVKPVPAATATTTLPAICSKGRTAITLTSTSSGVTFYDTAVVTQDPANGTISGYVNAVSKSITQTLANSGTTPGIVTYGSTPAIIISPTLTCYGTPVYSIVTVYPVATGTSSPTIDTILPNSNCHGKLRAGLVSNTSFTWTYAQPIGVTGASICSGSCDTVITNQLNNINTRSQIVTYTITPWANGCAGTKFSFKALVKPKPVITNAGTYTACSGLRTNVKIISSTSGTTFTYTAAQFMAPIGGVIMNYADGTGAAIAQTLINTGSTAGKLIYTITPNYQGSIGDAVHDTVVVFPVPNGSVTPSPNAICSGSGAGLTLQAGTQQNPPVEGTVFTWTPSVVSTISGAYSCVTTDGTCGTSINQTLTTSATNSPKEVYTITPWANGCAGTKFAATVSVQYGSPVKPIISGTIIGICQGNGSYTYTITNLAPFTTLTWTLPSGCTFGNGSTIHSNPVSILYPAGYVSDTVKATAMNYCFNSSDTGKLVTKAALATPGLITGTAGVCGNSGPYTYSIITIAGATSYIWTLPPGGVAASLTTSIPSISVTYTGAKSGILTVKAANSCTTGLARSMSIVVTCRESSLPVATNSELQMKVYPNPASERLTVQFTGAEGKEYLLNMMDITGRILWSKKNTVGEATNTVVIDAGDLSKGIYMLSLVVGDQRKQARVVIE